MENNNQVLKEEPDVECFRLQPKITIQPKQYLSCPNCQSRMEHAGSGEEVLENSDQKNLVAYYYKCPGCSKEWFYDLFFRPIFN
jgi:hypothetical protein